MIMAPPGRRSSSQTGVVNPCGLHHWATCAGSVQAANTRSLGASKIRVRVEVIAPGDGAAASIGGSILRFAVVIGLLLFLQFAEVFVQAVQPVVPEAAVRFDP